MDRDTVWGKIKSANAALREIMEERGVTFRELATKVGQSKENLNHTITYSELKADLLCKIAEGLDCEVRIVNLEDEDEYIVVAESLDDEKEDRKIGRAKHRGEY